MLRYPDVEEVARFIDHAVKQRFQPDVVRTELLRNDEVPGELIVRVYLPESSDLVPWAEAHRESMEVFRQDLSLRLPSAKLLEFTSDVPGAAVIALPDDGSLIFDLRENGGGSPDGVVFWCSYLFGEKTHLNDIFEAETGETKQFWSLSYVPGERYLDRPVYVLTSERTFSGGEDFCYTLQAQGRAEIIGETTGGGAHPTRGFPISPAVHIGIPFARSINPVTGTNWEGTGVVPDTAVPAEQAYDVAYAKALRHILELDEVPPPIMTQARETLAGLTLPA